MGAKPEESKRSGGPSLPCSFKFLIPAEFLFLSTRIYLIVMHYFPLEVRGICGINSSPCAGYQYYFPASGLLTALGCTRAELGESVYQYLQSGPGFLPFPIYRE